jgi:D-alanyl-D-alanine carboxypeptidase/D-alanyl-D-alanine-endopeptidase (penicillin-binding protein 4)
MRPTARYTLNRVLRTGHLRRLVLPLALLLVLVLPASALASLSSSLKRQMRAAGASSGAYVVDTDSGQALFSWKAGTPRVLASNVKLFTTAAALDRFGVDGTLTTEVVTDGQIDEEGVLRGGLWLRGGGDPAFGSRAYVRKHYGSSAASVEMLVDQLEDLGLRSVRGTIRGDESAFDQIRGVRDSRYYTSPWIGPLSGLPFNHGYDSNRRFQSNPPGYAAQVFRNRLRSARIRSGRAGSASVAPSDGTVLASVESPPMATLVRVTNKWSDNYFAEILLKDIGRDASGTGSTAAGVRAVRAFAARGGSRARLIDGSGLDHGNRASPRDVVRLLTTMRERDDFSALYDSLPIAGVDGTIHDRMERAPARRNCRAKTGSLTGVSALSGYCTTRGGREVAFSFLMNGISTSYARRIQDRMAQAIAGWSG